MAEIALCLSGGGYRAAVFHLGVLSYLHHVCLPEGGRLLDHVHTLTSVSGGAIPAIEYALNESKDGDRVTCFNQLFKKLIGNNIGEQMLDDFNHTSESDKSFIKSLALIYDKIFYNNEKFGKIIDAVPEIGLHHFAIVATDFELGIPFRFQATCELNIPGREELYGVIGNRTHKISRDGAKEIRLADIMAATSCFPLAFEPIAYPTDFKFGNQQLNRTATNAVYMLMDGGLVDNQGVDPAKHAEWHLAASGLHQDLVILSDAGNKPIKKEDKPVKWSKHSLRFWKYLLVIVALVCVVLSCLLFVIGQSFFAGFFAMASIAITFIVVIANRLVNKLKIYLCDSLQFPANFSMLWNTKINDIVTFLKSRGTTVYRMVDFVMMGHIKKVAYRELISKEPLQKRVILNSLPMLSNFGKWRNVLTNRNQPDKSLTPSKVLKRNTKKANAMKTTLWFTQDEIKKDIPVSLLACGQYTICWNLIQYIDSMKEINEEELTEGQKMIRRLEPILKGDWKRFNDNPRVLANSYTQ